MNVTTPDLTYRGLRPIGLTASELAVSFRAATSREQAARFAAALKKAGHK